VTRIDATSGDVAGSSIPTNAVGAGIAVGGGFVWVTDEATGSVVGIDPATNTVMERATVGAGPTGIAYGGGSLWVANSLDDSVSEVSTSTLQESGRIHLAGGPSSVSFSDGAVWVTSEFGSRLLRIDPHTGNADASIPIGNRPEGLAAGAGGVWVAAQASGVGHRGGRLVVDGGTLDSIDPAIADSTNSAAVIGLAYDGLTTFRHVAGAAGTQLVPDLATALPQPTAGGTIYTFHLRPGIRYSDGRLVRAVDFRRALVRALVLHGAAGNPFLGLAGARACWLHESCDLSRSVIVTGASTLTFRLPAPNPRLTYHLVWLFPVPAGTPLYDIGTKPVPSTGPYAFRSYVPGQLLTIVRNTHFHVWSPAARPDGYPDEIVYRVVEDDQEAVRDVLAGTADLAFEVSLDNTRLRQLEAAHARQLHLDPQYATAFVFLNTRRPPFDDVQVRRAISFAVDRQRIVDLHGSLVSRPTCQIVPPAVAGYRPYCPYTIAPDAKGDWKAPDLARARALIRASGTRGESVVVWSFDYFHPESEYFVSLLRRLGYRARLRYVPDFAAYARTLGSAPGGAQAGFDGWFAGGLAMDWFSQLTCGGGDNDWSHFCDKAINAQITRLAAEEPADPAGTAALAARIDRELTDAAPWVPIFTPSLPDLTSARVGNYQASDGVVMIDQLWVR
jgi:peptide/nickel transport system substrate-binding protein